MQLPKIFQGESLTRLLRGAYTGFLATVVIGFGWGGWMLGSTAKKMADQSTKSAIVAALAPICVDKFQHATEAKATLAELRRPICGNKTRSSRRAAGRRFLAWSGLTTTLLKLVPRCSTP